jgi:hypothetical protein
VARKVTRTNLVDSMWSALDDVALWTITLSQQKQQQSIPRGGSVRRAVLCDVHKVDPTYVCEITRVPSIVARSAIAIVHMAAIGFEHVQINV